MAEVKKVWARRCGGLAGVLACCTCLALVFVAIQPGVWPCVSTGMQTGVSTGVWTGVSTGVWTAAGQPYIVNGSWVSLSHTQEAFIYCRSDGQDLDQVHLSWVDPKGGRVGRWREGAQVFTLGSCLPHAYLVFHEYNATLGGVYWCVEEVCGVEVGRVAVEVLSDTLSSHYPPATNTCHALPPQHTPSTNTCHTPALHTWGGPAVDGWCAAASVARPENASLSCPAAPRHASTRLIWLTEVFGISSCLY